MNIKRIAITNFRGFEDEKIFDFGDNSFIILTAPNGKGKTSIIDAIEWCLTGDIKRLHEIYNIRNSTIYEKKQNMGAILKNKRHSDKKTSVEIWVTTEEEEYTIYREQEKDSLDDSSKIRVNNLEGEQADQILEKLVDKEDFYKYHFCDMQKTYRFLSKTRGKMDEEFADFSSNYTEVQTLINNLELIEDDLKKRIEQNQGQKISDKLIEDKELEITNYVSKPEILAYEKKKIFKAENTDIMNLTTEQLNMQLKMLYECGYQRIISLIKEKIVSKNAEIQKKKLERLQRELKIKEKQIQQAKDKKAYAEETLREAETNLLKYQKLKLTKENLESNSYLLFKIESVNFNKEFWNCTQNSVNFLEKRKKEINETINILCKGDRILDVLTALTAKREDIINYRSEMKKKAPGKIVLCPVCGSETFDQISEKDITRQAQNYQVEHRILIENEKKKLDDVEQREKDIWNIRLKKANMVLQEAIIKAKKEVDLIIELNNASKDFFSICSNLQKEDAERFSLDNMMSNEKIAEAIIYNDKKILKKSEVVEKENEIKRIAILVNEPIEGEPDDNLLNNFKTKMVSDSLEFVYDEQLLNRKINSIKSFLKNSEYVKVRKSLTELKEKNVKLEKEIESLTDLIGKVENKKNNIKNQMDKLKQEEFDQVGPYLYKLFCKLSRDVQIDMIQTQRKKGDKMALLDESDNPLVNMLSDGQLSVFMISYFFGNIFRLKGKETFPVYFIDDITSCMDDINMLAFLDLIKYQLEKQDRAMHQIFFATCNEKIRDLIEYKMKSSGIVYKEIGIDAF